MTRKYFVTFFVKQSYSHGCPDFHPKSKIIKLNENTDLDTEEGINYLMTYLKEEFANFDNQSIILQNWKLLKS